MLFLWLIRPYMVAFLLVCLGESLGFDFNYWFAFSSIQKKLHSWPSAVEIPKPRLASVEYYLLCLGVFFLLVASVIFYAQVCWCMTLPWQELCEVVLGFFVMINPSWSCLVIKKVLKQLRCGCNEISGARVEWELTEPQRWYSLQKSGSSWILDNYVPNFFLLLFFFRKSIYTSALKTSSDSRTTVVYNF